MINLAALGNSRRVFERCPFRWEPGGTPGEPAGETPALHLVTALVFGLGLSLSTNMLAL